MNIKSQNLVKEHLKEVTALESILENKIGVTLLINQVKCQYLIIRRKILKLNWGSRFEISITNKYQLNFIQAILSTW